MKDYYDVILKFVEKMIPYIDEEEFARFQSLIARSVKCAADAEVSASHANKDKNVTFFKKSPLKIVYKLVYFSISIFTVRLQFNILKRRGVTSGSITDSPKSWMLIC